MNKPFSDVLRNAREDAELSYDALAEKTGVSRQGLINIEKHGADPKWSTAMTILRACGIHEVRVQL